MTEGTRSSFCAAALKLPVFATATKARIGAIVSILHDSRKLNRRQAPFSAEWARLGFPQGRCTGFRFRGHQPNWREKMEMTMRKKILTMLVVPLIAALTAQAAA